MLNRCTILIFLSTLFCAAGVLAQVPDTTKYSGSEEIEQQIENLAERSDVEMDYSDWVEEMNLLRQRPVNLNSGDENELRRLFFLNDLQISNLLEYTQQYGQLASIYELQVIEGLIDAAAQAVHGLKQLDARHHHRLAGEKGARGLERAGHGQFTGDVARADVLGEGSADGVHHVRVRAVEPHRYAPRTASDAWLFSSWAS